MQIAVLFDGAGLARLGLEQAGHKCTGFELDPWKHHLSKFVGSGNCVLGDATQVDLSKFDAVWASPPCILRSVARHKDTKPRSALYSVDYVDWCLKLPHNPLWVECTMSYQMDNNWGVKYNAAQFLEEPIQIRNRIIGGTYKEPKVFRPYKQRYKEFDICPAILATEYKGGRRRATQWHKKQAAQNSIKGICPAITATEYKGCKTDQRRASRFYGKRLSIEQCAFHQGFEIPKEWYDKPDDFPGPPSKWTINLYEAIGNGVPVYMAQAFGNQYK